jgi:hypothetical protein
MPPILEKGMGCSYILKYFYKEFLCVLSDGQILYGTGVWGYVFFKKGFPVSTLCIRLLS